MNPPWLRNGWLRNGSRTDVVDHLVTVCGYDIEDAMALVPTASSKPAAHGDRTALTPAQLETFERTVKREIADDTMKTLLLLLPLTGLRVSEICSLTPRNLVVQNGRPGLLFVGKGSKERFVPLPKRGRALLEAYAARPPRPINQWVFPNTRSTGPFASSAVETACRGLAEREPTLRNLTPHVLRHTFATEALLNCKDMLALREAMGHASRSNARIAPVTLTYLHPSHVPVAEVPRCKDVFAQLVRHVQSKFLGPKFAPTLKVGKPSEFPKNRSFAYCAQAHTRDPIEIVIAEKLERGAQARIEGVLMHELGHAVFFALGQHEHEEREADALAQHLFGHLIRYDVDDVQTTGAGTSPRPARLR